MVEDDDKRPEAMQIVPATQADKAAWLPLWQAYLDFYQHPLPDEMTDLTFARMVDVSQPIGLFLAREGEQVLGFAAWVMHHSTWAKAGYVYLEDLFVTADARGNGVGKALIKAVTGLARERGAERLYWVTEAHNPARALYRKVAAETDYVQYRRPL